MKNTNIFSYYSNNNNAHFSVNQEEFEEFCEDFEFSRAYAALLSRRDESKTGIRIFDLFKKRFIYN